ncbi:MAG: RsmD family RNA methyltransferase [Myxococcota bacterium]
MKIVGGELRGRRIEVPANVTRPTSARVREALASALESRGCLEGATVLDLFAGSGALAFEALSRGATHATLVDKHGGVLRTLRKNVAALGLAGRTTLKKADAFGAPERTLSAASLVFLDPPYADAERLETVLGPLASVASGATVVVETAKGGPTFDGFLLASRSYEYGDTRVTIATLKDPVR